MKKINKLLKKLFGLELVGTKEYQHLLDTFELAKNRARRYFVRRDFKAGSPMYEVIGTTADSKALISIKCFYYEVGNSEDRNYAQLCAQELCNKLNEKF